MKITHSLRKNYFSEYCMYSMCYFTDDSPAWTRIVVQTTYMDQIKNYIGVRKTSNEYIQFSILETNTP